uniref:NAC domain-containing protein n=1 Tax=Opuntia streptacantha TaxID=393608 RepID=A0A7C9DPL8_OPUST
MPTVHKLGDDSPCWYDDQVSFMSDIESPRRIPIHLNYHASSNFQPHDIYPYNMSHNDPFLQLPPLESPKMPQSSMTSNSIMPYGHNCNLRPSSLNQEQILYSQPLDSTYGSNIESNQVADQATDWRVLDKFVASQLSPDSHAGGRIPD